MTTSPALSLRARMQPAGRSSALVRNAYALIINAGVVSLLGVVYWLVVAWMFPADEVGRDSAVVTSMVAVSSVAQLNLAVALPRLIPAARQHERALVGSVYLLNAMTGLVVGTLFIVIIPLFSSQLAFLRGGLGLVFGVSVVVWGMFSIQDSVLTGMRLTRWVPVENAVFGVVKILAAIGLAVLGVHEGIFYSWLVAAVLLVIPVNAILFRTALARSLRTPVRAVVAQLRSGGYLRYMTFDYLASLCKLAYATLLPLFVVARFGDRANAFFFMAFTVSLAVDAVPMAMSTSLTVEAAHDVPQLLALTRQAIRRLAWLMVPAVAITVVFAPMLLRPFGESYAVEGVETLRITALATLPRALIYVYSAMLRVRVLGGEVMVMSAAALVLGVVLMAVLPSSSVTSVALAWLVSHLVVAVAVTPRFVRMLRGAPMKDRGELAEEAA